MINFKFLARNLKNFGIISVCSTLLWEKGKEPDPDPHPDPYL